MQQMISKYTSFLRVDWLSTLELTAEAKMASDDELWDALEEEAIDILWLMDDSIYMIHVSLLVDENCQLVNFDDVEQFQILDPTAIWSQDEFAKTGARRVQFPVVSDLVMVGKSRRIHHFGDIYLFKSMGLV